MTSKATAIAFPSGDSRPIAVLAGEPSTLARRYGLHFAEGLDDLDRFQFATIDLGDCCQAVLYKHFGDANPGTVVRIDANADVSSARRELTVRLALTDADILWWSPNT